MGTRSMIGMVAGENADGTPRIRAVYCHWDGYPGHVGRTLHQHYTETAKVEALLALGAISSLGEEIGEKHDFDYAMDSDLPPGEYQRLRRMCNVYGRDRGEDGTEAEDFANVDAFLAAARGCWAEYVYVWHPERAGWTVRERLDGGKWSLPDHLAQAVAETA